MLGQIYWEHALMPTYSLNGTAGCHPISAAVVAAVAVLMIPVCVAAAGGGVAVLMIPVCVAAVAAAPALLAGPRAGPQAPRGGSPLWRPVSSTSPCAAWLALTVDGPAGLVYSRLIYSSGCRTMARATSNGSTSPLVGHSHLSAADDSQFVCYLLC